MAASNWTLAGNAQQRRTAYLQAHPNDPTALSASIQSIGQGPGWDAFFEGLNGTEDAAHAAGMNFKASAGGSFNDMLPPSTVTLYGSDPYIAQRLALGKAQDQDIANFRLNQANAQLADLRNQAAADQAQQQWNLSAGIDRALQPGLTRDQALAAAGPGAIVPVTQLFSAQDAAAAKQAEDLAKQAEIERHNRQQEAAANPFAGQGGLGGALDPSAAGDKALANMPPAMQNMVKSLAEGRMPFPSSFALKTPFWQNVLQAVQQYDPSFDTSLASSNARQKVRNDFTSGKSATEIKALNTVIGHIGQLSDKIDSLHNSGSEWWNTIANALTPGGSKTGVALNDFNMVKNAVTSELTRVYRGTGGSEQDIKDWAATIGDAKSPAQLHSAMKQIGGLLQSKLDALGDQYRQGMGRDPINLLAPEAKGALDRMAGRDGQPAAAGNGMVMLLAPDGKTTKPVPADQVDHYLALGAKRVQ